MNFLTILSIIAGVIFIVAFIEALKRCIRGIKWMREAKIKSKEIKCKKESKVEEVIC